MPQLVRLAGYTATKWQRSMCWPVVKRYGPDRLGLHIDHMGCATSRAGLLAASRNIGSSQAWTRNETGLGAWAINVTVKCEKVPTGHGRDHVSVSPASSDLTAKHAERQCLTNGLEKLRFVLSTRSCLVHSRCGYALPCHKRQSSGSCACC